MSRKQRELTLPNLENGFAHLQTKPSARISYSFVPQSGPNSTHPERLLVFLSGLDSPKTLWQKTLNKLVENTSVIGTELPPMLLYDRFGCGGSDPDPNDSGKRPEEYHEVNDSVSDLRQLIVQTLEQKYPNKDGLIDNLGVVFCAHSIGVPIARLYAEAFPKTVEAVLILDSAIAGMKAEYFTPNPDDPNDADKVRLMSSHGVTPDMLRDAIRKVKASPFSGYTMTTRERLRWDHMPQLLPFSDRPKLRGPRPELPLVTVVWADLEVGLPQVAKTMQVPEPVVLYVWKPMISDYRAGLPHLQGKGRGKGPITAPGGGHMIHVDTPDLVARELLELLMTSSRLIHSRI